MRIDDPVEEGREAYGRQAWATAHAALSTADERGSLDAEDLTMMGTAAYLSGRMDAAADAWQRAHVAFLGCGRPARAVRCAFWLALVLMQHGDHARGGGWLARAQGVLDEAGLDCAERGYLRIPPALGALEGGDPAAAYAEFDRIVEIADRFGDTDLRALGGLGRGQALIAGGQARRGARVLDEVMVAVTAGEVSAIAAGIVYCGVIVACRGVFDLRRAREWTAALSRWCDAQEDLTAFRGQCLVHRSEIMQMCGEWTGAMDEARRACERLSDPPGDPVLGMALYQQAELLRLRGEFARAEETYRRASRSGHPVQPGLALLRLAQGRVGDAVAAMRRVVEETEGVVERARMLAAYTEIALAAGEVETARTATGELGNIAAVFDSSYLRALVEYARGTVLLADGDAARACSALRRAWTSWRELDAPYEAARARLGMARACRRLNDHDTADLELDAARRVFEDLGAAPALAEAWELAGAPRSAAGGLTPRELEVLRLVATGATNRQIAETLLISDKTVARHVANIFTKLGLSSRAAATAFAYEHDLL
ncbi:response regulator transcription factor [Spirillospora sp. NPDC048819]|uniref:response regulator transcription factor n=1 Tax=Spirillospora sp. NPDC048819 TaxID=3155268 RepID=UPI0033BFB9DD